MKITKNNFSETELTKFALDYSRMNIHTEPLSNIIVSSLKNDLVPVVHYYQQEYLSNQVYSNYVNASTIINPFFLKFFFGVHHFTFYSNIKHNNYILNYGNSQFLVSNKNQELITNCLNMHTSNEILKDVIGFLLNFQKMITLYGISDNAPKNYQQFFKRMIKNPYIKNIIYSDYELKLSEY